MKKKKVYLFLIIFLLVIVLIPFDVNALSDLTLLAADGFCTKSAKIIKLVGRIFKIFKIVVPIVIIVFASIDLAKGVVAQKEDEINKGIETLIKRIILGIIIFFVPSIVSLIFKGMGSFMNDEVASEYQVCAECIINSSECP